MATLEELQQQIAALTDRLDGITAPPSDYYTSRFTGEELDDGVERSKTGGVIDQNMATLEKTLEDKLTGVNLLDNWYFGNPVNQRGLLEYTGPGYAFDRWKLYDNKCCAKIKDDCVSFTRIGQYYSALQYIDIPKRLSGKTVVFSAYIKSSTTDFILRIMHGMTSLVNDYRIPAGSTGVFEVHAKIPDEITDQLSVVFYQYGASVLSEIDVYAAKLELGSRQTLAHQAEDGSWVLNDPPPDPALELAKCQRYFWRLKAAQGYSTFIYGVTPESTSRAIGHISFPVPMRGIPAITVSGSMHCGSPGAYGIVTSIKPDQFTGNLDAITMGRLFINTEATMSTTLPLILRANGDKSAYIDFSADL